MWQYDSGTLGIGLVIGGSPNKELIKTVRRNRLIKLVSGMIEAQGETINHYNVQDAWKRQKGLQISLIY